MWKIRKFTLQSGLKLITTRMIDDVLTNRTTDAGFLDLFNLFVFSGAKKSKSTRFK